MTECRQLGIDRPSTTGGNATRSVEFVHPRVGAATAHADDTGSVNDADSVNDAGSGNTIGSVHGNVVNTQQTAAGSAAGNQSDGLAVTGNTGSVSGNR